MYKVRKSSGSTCEIAKKYRDAIYRDDNNILYRQVLYTIIAILLSRRVVYNVDFMQF